jgi:hypothetical protein
MVPDAEQNVLLTEMAIASLRTTCHCSHQKVAKIPALEVAPSLCPMIQSSIAGQTPGPLWQAQGSLDEDIFRAQSAF